jgi:hypothetical protein
MIEVNIYLILIFYIIKNYIKEKYIFKKEFLYFLRKIIKRNRIYLMI